VNLLTINSFNLLNKAGDKVADKGDKDGDKKGIYRGK